MKLLGDKQREAAEFVQNIINMVRNPTPVDARAECVEIGVVGVEVGQFLV